MSNLLKKSVPVGFLFVGLALVVNEWTVARLISADGSLEFPNLIILRVADALALVVGGALLFFRLRVPVPVFLFNFVLFGFLLLCVEGGLVWLKSSAPNSATWPVLGSFTRELYNSDKELIQFRPECAQHDDSLGYTLRPGTCTFSGAEFSNEYRINHLGLRDDEESLEAPEIIVLGDSYAMGWGVDQEQTFAEILASKTGKKVLNAAISSYGTARQILSLERLDTSRLETLVIQYCHNDYEENESFLRNDHQMSAMRLRKYERLVKTHRDGRRYFLGKHLLTLARTRVRRLHRLLVDWIAAKIELPRKAAATASDEAICFVDIVTRAQKNLNSARVLVLELGPQDTQRSSFVDEVAQRQANDPTGTERVQALDLTSTLGSEHFYPLDGHINAAGHATVAEAILQALSSHEQAGENAGSTR
jgi:lysophospholipase L1-like esterase